MPLLNFKNTSSEKLPEIKDTGLKLMLWAGDIVHDNKSDIQRLPGYDVYVCYGYSPGLDINIEYMNSLPNSHRIYLCVLDVYNKRQMDIFTNLFLGKFSVIDSDYIGNTPSLSKFIYSKLLEKGGVAYHTEGINSIRMPLEDHMNLLELFAPLLTYELNLRRHYTEELIKEAKENKLTPAETWSSPDLKHVYYDGLRCRQEEFIIKQESRSPLLRKACLYSIENLKKYWSELPLDILTTQVENLPTEMTYLYEYMPQLYTFLLDLVSKECPGLDQGHKDYMVYIESVESITARVSRCQHVLNKQFYCKIIREIPLLVPALKYYLDTRYTESPKRVYGVTISKV